MMESIALTESNMIVDTAAASDEDYVIIQDNDEDMEDIGDDASYDMCDEEDDFMAGLVPILSPVPSISSQDFKDLDTLIEENGDANVSIGASVVSIEGDDVDDNNKEHNSREKEDHCRDDANDGAPALLSDVEASVEIADTTPQGSTKMSPTSNASAPSDEDLKKAEQHEAANKTLKSRPSNKKRRKKIKMMKKAAAAAAAAAALSEMNNTMTPAAAAASPASTMSPPRQHSMVKTATTKSLASRKTNNQVAIATETLARFRAEHGL